MFRKKDKHGAASDAAADAAPETGLTPKKAKNAVRVAKIVVPAVAPALAPLAVKAAGAAREAYDRYQARRLGVSIDALPEYAGKGGLLLARIADPARPIELIRVP